MQNGVLFYEEKIERTMDQTLDIENELEQNFELENTDLEVISEDEIVNQAAELDEKVTAEIEQEDVMSVSSLSYYMKKISKYHPMPKQEEQALGHKIRQGDKEAFDQLINANLKFVVTVAYKFRNSGLPMLDIINQGNLGLVEAAKRYDPERGVKFISYAVWWIRQYIVQGIAEQGGTVRLPIKQASNLFKINFAREKLKQETSREPTIMELAEHLKMKEEDVTDILRVSKQSLSLETPLKEGEDKTFVNILEATGDSIEEGLFKKNLKEVLDSMVKELDLREMQIINLRFGLEDDTPQTLDELGKMFGVSRERVRQLEARALDKLKKKAVKKGLQEYLAS